MYADNTVCVHNVVLHSLTHGHTHIFYKHYAIHTCSHIDNMCHTYTHTHTLFSSYRRFSSFSLRGRVMWLDRFNLVFQKVKEGMKDWRKSSLAEPVGAINHGG